MGFYPTRRQNPKSEGRNPTKRATRFDSVFGFRTRPSAFGPLMSLMSLMAPRFGPRISAFGFRISDFRAASVKAPIDRLDLNWIIKIKRPGALKIHSRAAPASRSLPLMLEPYLHNERLLNYKRGSGVRDTGNHLVNLVAPTKAQTPPGNSQTRMLPKLHCQIRSFGSLGTLPTLAVPFSLPVPISQPSPPNEK